MSKTKSGSNKAPRKSSKEVQLTKEQNALVGFVQAATGFLASDRKDIVRDVSHLVQRGIQLRLATGVVEVYNNLKQRTKIQEDYETTDQFRQQTSYLFDAIKSDGAIDEKKFAAIKNLFLNSAKEQLSDRNNPLPVVLMRICSELEAGEIMVLETCYRLNQEIVASLDKTPRYNPNDNSSWPNLIAKESGLNVPDLISKYEQTLISKGLLNQRSAGGHIIADTNYHLSGTGIELCKFIRDYEIDN